MNIRHKIRDTLILILLPGIILVLAISLIMILSGEKKDNAN